MFRLAGLEVEGQAWQMRIRELATQAGTSTRTLRYYEEQGLLPAGRSANGYRVYDEHHVRVVREIRSLQAIGFSLADVRPFVECPSSARSSNAGIWGRARAALVGAALLSCPWVSRSG
jgi:DNA-binding transcriptional MerR regulator